MVHALSLLWHSVSMRRTTSDNDKPWSSGLFGWPKIRSFDPSLPAVWTAHPSQPLLALFDPPVELASSGPRGCLNLDGADPLPGDPLRRTDSTRDPTCLIRTRFRFWRMRTRETLG